MIPMINIYLISKKLLNALEKMRCMMSPLLYRNIVSIVLKLKLHKEYKITYIENDQFVSISRPRIADADVPNISLIDFPDIYIDKLGLFCLLFTRNGSIILYYKGIVFSASLADGIIDLLLGHIMSESDWYANRGDQFGTIPDSVYERETGLLPLGKNVKSIINKQGKGEIIRSNMERMKRRYRR